MRKEIVAKTQRISPKLSPVEKSFSSIIEVKLEEEEESLHKGILYGIYFLSEETAYETDLVNKLIEDILRRSYYQSDNISPVQVLESAVIEVKEAVFQFTDEQTTEKAKFDITIAVLKENILYIVRYGEGEEFIVRAGEFKEIDMVTENKFSVSTGRVKEDDVVILSTKPFAQRYKPKDLLRLDPSALENLESTEACLMIKFDVQEASDDKTNVEDLGKMILKKPNKTKDVLSKIKKTIVKRKPPVTRAGVRKLTSKSNFQFNKKLLTYIVTGILITSFAAAIIYSINNELRSKPSREMQESVLEDVSMPDNDSALIAAKDPEIFYDLKIVDSNVDPLSIAVIQENIYVLGSQGELYISDTKIPGFKILPDLTFDGGYRSKIKEEELFIKAAEQLHVYDTVGDEIRSLSLPEAAAFCPYLEYIYQIEGGSIYRYPSSEAGSDKVLWADSNDFEGARDMSIAISIFIITRDGEIVRYTSGVKDGFFEISSLETPLENPTLLEANWNWGNIYIADEDNNRVLVLSREGSFVAELSNSFWSNIQGAVPDKQEQNLFVLSGTRVYKIPME